MQLGVGVSGGAEVAVHAARRLVSSLPAGHVVIKFDFSNAFNCVRRDLILDSIATNIPEIYWLVYSAFSCEPVLTLGSHEILSREGAQQGDPLGHWSSEAIHPLLLQEAQLSPSDRTMRLVSSNLASYHATVQKLLIQ